MTRLLHLLGRAPDPQTDHHLRTLRAGAGVNAEHAVQSIGRGGDYANLLWAVIGLRRAVEKFDIVHAWDERALVAAALAGARRLAFTAPPDLRRRDVDRLRLVIRDRDVQIMCASAAERARLAARGISPDRLHLVRPPVEVPSAPVTRDTDLRRRLGIADDDFVLLAAGESTRAAAHDRAVWTGSILHVTDECYRVVLWGRGAGAQAAAALGRKLRQPGLVIVAEHALGRATPFEDLLPAADAMLATARGPVSPLAMAMGMAAGVPVIAVETPLVRELNRARHAVLTPPADAPRLLAQCVLELRADPALRDRLVRAGRETAGELFAPDHAAERYRDLYASFGPAELAGSRRQRARDDAPVTRWESPALASSQLNAEDA